MGENLEQRELVGGKLPAPAKQKEPAQRRSGCSDSTGEAGGRCPLTSVSPGRVENPGSGVSEPRKCSPTCSPAHTLLLAWALRLWSAWGIDTFRSELGYKGTPGEHRNKAQRCSLPFQSTQKCQVYSALSMARGYQTSLTSTPATLFRPQHCLAVP